VYYLAGTHLKQIRSKTGIRKIFKEQANSRNSINIVVLLQDVEDAYNVGGMFRVADAAGVTEIILTGKTPTPDTAGQIAVTSMGAHRRVKWSYVERYVKACETLQKDGYSLVAVEVAEGAEHYQLFDYPEKTCLILGNEGAGVAGSIIKMCDAAVFIPMVGKGRSINVHVAGAIILFEATLRQNFAKID
jgi:23S rRNA (guanosine2251-2'-O)-methyltransferase